MTVRFGEAEAENDDDPYRHNDADIDGSQRNQPFWTAAALFKGDGHQHYQRRKQHEGPLRLYLVVNAADKKEDERADTIDQQATDKRIFYFNPGHFIKEKPTYQRARHQQLVGDVRQAVEQAVLFAGALK